MNPPPIHEGDIVRGPNGDKWRVTRTWHGTRVVAVAHLTDHVEMAINVEDLQLVEAHPGGAR